MQGMDWVQTMGQRPPTVLRLAGRAAAPADTWSTSQFTRTQGDAG